MVAFLITLIFGIDKNLYKRLSPSDRKKLNFKLPVLLLSVIMAAIISIEISHSMLEDFDLKIIIPVTFGWMFITGLMDVILLRGAAPPGFRLSFSIALVIISTIMAFSFLARKDIQNEGTNYADVELQKIDSTYLAAKNIRYTEYNTRLKNKNEYHNSLCHPESLKIRAGEEYNKKHQFCIDEENFLTPLKSSLDTNEKRFNSIYEENRKKASTISSLGVFEQIQKTIEYIFESKTKIVFFVLLSIILLSIESIVFFTSLNMKDKNLDILKQRASMYISEINEKEMELEHSATIGEIEKRKKLTDLKSRMDELLLLKHIQKEYNTFKELQPELQSNTRFTSMDITLNNLIFDNQKEVEAIFKGDDDLEINSTIKTVNKEDEFDTNLFYKTFYCSTPMKEFADSLFIKTKGNLYDFSKALFEWTVKNINYQVSHNLDHYKTAREVYNASSGICGEMAIFFNAILKYKGFDALYIHIDIDVDGKRVNHASSAINYDNKIILIDPAYGLFDASHQKWNIVTDAELINNMKSWNQ